MLRIVMIGQSPSDDCPVGRGLAPAVYDLVKRIAPCVKLFDFLENFEKTFIFILNCVKIFKNNTYGGRYVDFLKAFFKKE